MHTWLDNPNIKKIENTSSIDYFEAGNENQLLPLINGPPQSLKIFM